MTMKFGCFTSVVGEMLCKVGGLDLLCKQILLVEEEDDSGILEPRVGNDGLEQCKALKQTVLRNHRGT